MGRNKTGQKKAGVLAALKKAKPRPNTKKGTGWWAKLSQAARDEFNEVSAAFERKELICEATGEQISPSRKQFAEDLIANSEGALSDELARALSVLSPKTIENQIKASVEQ